MAEDKKDLRSTVEQKLYDYFQSVSAADMQAAMVNAAVSFMKTCGEPKGNEKTGPSPEARAKLGELAAVMKFQPRS